MSPPDHDRAAPPTALVTGANRGLGEETCRQLLERGWRVVATARDMHAGAATMARLREATGADDDRLLLRRLDVSSAEAASVLAQWLRASGIRLQALVNNAGVFMESRAGGDADVLAVDPTTVLQTINVNTLGPLRLVQALHGELDDGARVVNVSSGMGQLADMGPDYLGYRASKAALNVLTRVLAQRLAERGIAVNACCPGWVRTDMGGAEARRSVAEGADTITWLATGGAGTASGGFYRDREAIAW
jgi:NAD(P)-dependent dehydrogenase (short-subunit alcohol dehydrogenase family)